MVNPTQPTDLTDPTDDFSYYENGMDPSSDPDQKEKEEKEEEEDHLKIVECLKLLESILISKAGELESELTDRQKRNIRIEAKKILFGEESITGCCYFSPKYENKIVQL